LVLVFAVIAVSALTLLLVIGAAIAPYSIVFAKKHSSGGNNNGNDQIQKDDSSNGSNTPSEQPTNSADQPPSTDGNTLAPPPPIQPLLPVNPPASEVDCSKTPDDPSCPSKPVPPVDCVANPTDPSCPSKPVPPVDCVANPTDPSCPSSSEDCEPSYPSLCLPKGSDVNCEGPNGLKAQGKHDFIVKEPDPYDLDRDGDGIGCEDGQPTGGNGNGNGNNVHVTVHKHITSNSNPTSVVTRNTKITDQLTVGQAIEGCKDITKKSPDNALKKSCNIMMAATFNYCMTHTKLWLTDSNICSDNLYLKNVQRYIAENVNLKLFPATIYNIRP
jgi:hypothetical protein